MGGDVLPKTTTDTGPRPARHAARVRWDLARRILGGLRALHQHGGRGGDAGGRRGRVSGRQAGEPATRRRDLAHRADAGGGIRRHPTLIPIQVALIEALRPLREDVHRQLYLFFVSRVQQTADTKPLIVEQGSFKVAVALDRGSP